MFSLMGLKYLYIIFRLMEFFLSISYWVDLLSYHILNFILFFIYNFSKRYMYIPFFTFWKSLSNLRFYFWRKWCCLTLRAHWTWMLLIYHFADPGPTGISITVNYQWSVVIYISFYKKLHFLKSVHGVALSGTINVKCIVCECALT